MPDSQTTSQTTSQRGSTRWLQTKPWYRDWTFRLFLIVVGTLSAYFPVTQCGFIWDDDDYVLENPTLTSTAGLKSIWADPSATPQYYPLVHSSFWLEYQLWGLDPTGYHVVNVLLHLGNALLLWRVLTQLHVPGAWLAALLFAIHPVHVESVAWITERKNVLSGFFYLAAFLAYLKFWQADVLANPTNKEEIRLRHWSLYGVAGLLYVAALLSKTVTATFPAALAVVIWWKNGAFRRKDLLALAPLFVLGIGFGLLTVWLEKHQVGAKGMEWDFSFVDRILIAGRALWFYAGKLIWPHPLIFTYPRWEIDDQAIWQYLFPALAAIAILLLWVARLRIGRGPLSAVLLFAGTLFPALGFFDVYPMRFSFVADHFQYLASIPLLTLFAAALTMLGTWLRSRWTEVVYLATTAALALFMGLTFKQVKIYEGLEVLWRDTLAKNPTSWMAHNNLGTLLNKRGDYAESIEHLQKAVKLKPDYVEGFSNLGDSLAAVGNLEEAEAAYFRSLELHPGFPAANNGMSVVQARQGDLEAALRFVHKALEVKPDYAEAYSNLGSILASQQKIDEAIGYYRRAVELDPSITNARYNLSLMLLQSGKFNEAEAVLRPLYEETPEDLSVAMNLGVALAQQQKYRSAIPYFERVLVSEPMNVKANYNLGVIYQAIGKEDQAAVYLQRFESLQPKQ